MHSLFHMGLLVAITSLMLASGGVAKPVPEGCEKRCEKQTVPCTDGRAEDQMMCFEVIKRCEIRCDPRAAKTPAKAENASIKK